MAHQPRVDLYPLWPTEPPDGYRGQLEDAFQEKLRSDRAELTLDDCSFYHRSTLSTGETMDGPWALGGREREYLGNCDFAGARVLELGPATGHLSFWMEGAGADVVSLEAGFDATIDLIAPAEDLPALTARHMAGLAHVNNSWWYLHRDRKSRARMVYSSIYRLPDDVGTFDVSVFGSILLHLRDPFRAIQEAASHTSHRIIVADMYYDDLERSPYVSKVERRLRRLVRAKPGQPGGGDPRNVVRFAPVASGSGSATVWWNLSPHAVVNMLQRVGFERTEVLFHSQLYRPDDGPREHVDVAMFTVVGHKR